MIYHVQSTFLVNLYQTKNIPVSVTRSLLPLLFASAPLEAVCELPPFPAFVIPLLPITGTVRIPRGPWPGTYNYKGCRIDFFFTILSFIVTTKISHAQFW